MIKVVKITGRMGADQSSEVAQKTSGGEYIKQQKKKLLTTKRSMNREFEKLGKQELMSKRKLKMDHKKGESTQILKLEAKEIVQIQKSRLKCKRSIVIIEQAIIKLNTINITSQVSEAFKTIVKALRDANRLYPVDYIKLLLAEYEKQQLYSNVAEEMIEDTFDDMEEDDQDEEEAEVLEKIFDELGIELKLELGKNTVPEEEIINNNDEELYEQLKGLNIDFVDDDGNMI